MMPLWVPLLTLVGGGVLIAIGQRTGIPELVTITVTVTITAAAVLVMVLRLLPVTVGGGAGNPVRDWTILLAPWVAAVVAVIAVAVREWLWPERAPVPQADCSRCQAELYEDSTGRGRFYSGEPVGYLCPEDFQLPGSRRHDPVPRAIAASVPG